MMVVGIVTQVGGMGLPGLGWGHEGELGGWMGGWLDGRMAEWLDGLADG